MVSIDLVTKFAQAVALQEGFYVLGSVPQRANNPCNLTDDGDVGCGVIQTAGPNGAKITIYPDVDAGWAAASKKFSRMLDGRSKVYLPNLTLTEVGVLYSGTGEWGTGVAQILNLPPTTTLQQIADSDTQWNAV